MTTTFHVVLVHGSQILERDELRCRPILIRNPSSPVGRLPSQPQQVQTTTTTHTLDIRRTYWATKKRRNSAEMHISCTYTRTGIYIQSPPPHGGDDHAAVYLRRRSTSTRNYTSKDTPDIFLPRFKRPPQLNGRLSPQL